MKVGDLSLSKQIFKDSRTCSTMFPEELNEDQPHKSICALKYPINKKGADNSLTRLSRLFCAILKCGGIYTLHKVILLQQLPTVLYLIQVPHGVYLSL